MDCTGVTGIGRDFLLYLMVDGQIDGRELVGR